MKKCLVCLFIIFLFAINANLSALTENLYITGMNQAEFIYKNTTDPLKSYLYDEFKFDLSHNNFRFGMVYEGEFPKYDKFQPVEELSSDDVKTYWKSRFVEYSTDNFLIRGGTYDAVFGSGLVLHAYDDEVMDEDNRLEGIYTRTGYNNFSLKALYGAASNRNYQDKNDIVSGVNINFMPISDLTLGSSFLSERYYVAGPEYEYNERDVLSADINLQKQLFDWKTELAATKKYHTVSGIDIEGHAIYSNLNVYLNKFTFTAAYKNYNDFDDRFSEPPTVNYSEEPLAETGDYSLVGKDEEGLMGIIRFIPNYSNEFVVNYSEGWSSDYEVRQSDLHTVYHKNFESLYLSLEFEHLEMVDDKNQHWQKEVTPKASVDFLVGDYPILLKAEYEIKKKDDVGTKTTTYTPLFQAEAGYKNYSLSLIASAKYHIDESIMDSSPKVGVELYAPLWSHTNMKLFLGKEKGGKVCRNGVCNYQTPFSGARLTLTTRF